MSINDASLGEVEVALQCFARHADFRELQWPDHLGNGQCRDDQRRLWRTMALIYQPGTGYTGADDLNITVSDPATGLQASGDVAITVEPTKPLFDFAEHEYFVEPPDSTVTMEVDRSGLMSGAASVSYLSGQTVTFADQQGSAEITVPLSAITMPLEMSSAGLPYFQVELPTRLITPTFLIPPQFTWLTTTSNRLRSTTPITPRKIRPLMPAGGGTNPVC